MTDSLTDVLVHGAFADASGFAVITELEAAGHTVVAPPNPLRSLAGDAAAIHAAVASIEGPVVSSDTLMAAPSSPRRPQPCRT